MGIYKETKDYKLIHDNMLNMDNYIEDGTIDCIITDPPYELGFMGKKWDGSGIAFNVEAWTKCFNALKDGGYLLAFGGTRTFHRIACAIEDAGFEIRDTIMYLYGSGFPKSLNIGLAVDKLNGVESKVITKVKGSGTTGINERGNQQFVAKNQYDDGTYDLKQAQNEWKGWGTALKPAYEPIIVARKPMKTSVAENVLKNRVGGINIDECRIPFGNETDSRVGTDVKRGDSLKYKYNGIDFEVLKRYENDEDYVWSENLNLSKINVDNIGEFLDCINMVGYQLQFDLTQYEEIIIDTHLKHIIPVVDTFKNNLGSNSMFGVSDKGVQMYKGDGRFPANIIHDNSEEVVKGFPESSSNGGNADYSFGNQDNTTRLYTNIKSGNHFEDSGNASRFFYTAKASKKDRDEGLDAFELKRESDRVRDDGVGGDNPRNRTNKPRKNTHPTVKPIELMQYLVRLVAPKGATILDCFMGSNSTGKAVMFENRERNANYKFIGIELTDEYLPICEARIEYAINKYEYDEKVERAKTGQLSLFEEMEL